MTHLLFLFVSGAALLFVLVMRHRLHSQYPDDKSSQMQAMLGFLRGMAVFIAVVFVIVLVDFARITFLR
jgi:type IV secretory pathway VirB2 component (pilin)